MMDKAKLMKEAQKFLSKGNIDKAIEVWIQIAKSSPDGNTFNYIGDLYVKKGDKQSAIAQYHKAADKYTNEGFSLKALAIHKKVLNINPKDPKALIALGQLNEEKNIVTDAIKYYLAAADILAKDNKKDELIEVFDRIISLAPTNIKLRVKVSELFSKEGFVPEAAKEYCNIANLFIQRNELAGAQEYLTKAIEIMPGNKDVLLALSDLSEKKGDVNQASEYLKNAMERTGESSDILLRRARLLAGSGSIEESVADLRKARELDPDNIDIRKQLTEVYQQAGDQSAAWQEGSALVDSLISAERSQEAIELLEVFKEIEPVDNRRKLITIYKMAADNDNAFAELYGLHEVLVKQGQVDAAVTSLKEANELKPGDSLVTDRLAELEGQAGAPVPGTEFATEPMTNPLHDAAKDSVGVDEPPKEKTLEDALSEADVFLKYSLHDDARTLLEEMKVKYPDSIELHQKLKSVYREAANNQLAVSQCLELNELFKSQGDEAAAAAEIEEAKAIDPSDERLAAYAGGAAPVSGAVEAGEDISADMSEADFYEQQGLLKEAADAYRRVLAKSPGHSDAAAGLAKIEKELAGASAPGPAPKPKKEVKPFMGEEAESDSLFDFGSILGDDQEGPAIDDMDEDVLGIFDEFKKGLAQEIADEDASTHYDLGIAYKEMGVVDDAIKEFQLASRDPKFFTQSTTMIGICQMSVGRHDEAIDAFSAAIMKADPSNDTWWSLKYDLATAYEISGKQTEAFEIYRDVYNWDVTFREVAKKYEALKGVIGAGASQVDSPSGGKASKSDGKKSRVSYI